MSGFFAFLIERLPDIMTALREHLTLSLVAVALGSAISLPLAVLLVHSRLPWLSSIVFFIANLLQTIPSLALLAILIPLMGIGMKPAILALLLYSIMPVLRNTYEGFRSVDPHVLEAARGLGYSSVQSLLRVQLPLALPYIMSGVRLTTVYIISWTTLATLVGAGGLGQLIMAGMGVNQPYLIIAGALGAIVLALVADLLLGWLESLLNRRFGMRGGAAA
ncbi:ABC transporter permease [Paenibacillus herberti]|uniref:Choline ABC transporter permease n=1 Tax=Paenibacillus herberti TaxID=1619309 RepID=A0A229NTP0_9BACL|nr:ABC transporter permease [Paenibacillus herberti]OXM13192.1 choline ABC transporter permease [Paenibacillus herberti]